MNNELLTSRFFKVDDKRTDEMVFPLPLHWWSRFYEYPWAAEFCKETDVVLDAACGIAHPFKFYLAGKCKAAHAIDVDERINDYASIAAEIDAIFGSDARQNCPEEFFNQAFIKQGSITELPYKNNMFDKAFCISVLEHLSDKDKVKALAEFKRVLKNGGMLILTLDYPDTTMDFIEGIANAAGLKLASDKDMTIPQNAIHWNNSLYCFRMVFVKKKDGE
jgi:ubiquinone/menaquinone biosynthesis C-methylase UbiE